MSTEQHSRLNELQARPYQVELLEKAKQKNIIVYLGTGSGKTFIAVMLIKHMRDQLVMSDRKVVFLVNNVALLDQQTKVINDCTGLSTGSYCGGDGVDDWDKRRWAKEVQKHSVLVLIHQVFLNAVTHGFIAMSNIALLVIDECHHAVKNHPYSKIMKFYHDAKTADKVVPKVLGLSASIVVKSVEIQKFREEKCKLEKTLDAEVETADGLSLQLFVSSAREKLVYYDKCVSVGCDQIKEVINQARLELLLIKNEELKQIEQSQRDDNSKATSKDSLNKDYKFFANQIIGNIGALLELGVYAIVAMEASILDLIENKNGNCSIWYDKTVNEKMVEIAKKYYENIVEIAKTQMAGFCGNEEQRILKFSRPKVLTLFEVIRNKGGDENNNEADEMRCIIFVERKLTSLALQLLIWKLKLPSVKDVGYAYSPNAHRNVVDPREREDVNKEKYKMKETFRQFRTGSKNVLVSTSVVEEGIDVPSCNLVVKFDFPQTFRSYVRSKGRARKNPSKYIMLVEEGDKEKERKYEEWKEVYEMSLRECHERTNVEVETEEEDDEMYSTMEAKIDGTQAVILLHQYLQKITVDRFTKLTLAWKVDKAVASKNQVMLFCGLGLPPPSGGFKATVQLPHKTPLHTPVTGRVKSRKDWAKRSAALQAVKLLHQKGDFDDSLKVRKRIKLNIDDYDDNDDDSDDEDKKSIEGIKRSRNFCRQSLPPFLEVNSTAQVFYLHCIEFMLKKPLTNPRYRLFYPQHYSHCFGMITSQPIPTIGPLEIFSASGLTLANVSLKQKITLTAQQQKLLTNFHQYIFSRCLTITELLEPLNTPAPLLVPVLAGNQIDFNVCNDVFQQTKAGFDTVKKINTAEISSDYNRLEKFYYDLVLFPLTPHEGGPTQYFVEEISTELTAGSLMNDMGLTFQEYHQVYNQTKVQDTKQPLFRIASANKALSMLSEGGEPVADGKKRTHRSYKVPELMGVEPIAAGLWKQAQMVPWVLHRVTSILGALPFTQGWEGKILNLHDELVECDGDKMMQFMMTNRSDESNRSPSPGQIVKALTLAAAGDRWDMERMEILGDAFLKFSTTIFLYYNMSSSCDEGDLTLARAKIVGNRNLFHIAENLELANCGIISTRMDPAETWTPPGYQSATITEDICTLEDKIVELDKEMEWGATDIRRWIATEDLRNLQAGNITGTDLLKLAKNRRKEHEAAGVKLRDYRLVSDKAQADCIEAMIGCYLLHCGINNTLSFMARIGLTLTSNALEAEERKQSEGFVSLPFPEADAFVKKEAVNTTNYSSLLKKLGVDEIEEIIGYKFKEKSFLLQAFTHPSFGDNRFTASYERLEFLGDAVLDYLVTCYIYTHTDGDPGRLTDIRSALVCNNMFASLLTDFSLDKYILHCNPGIYVKIREYLDDKWWDDYKPEHASADRTLKQINEEDPPELEMVEVPKVLGDVYEAIIGGIYIDSGHNLEVVWGIYKRLCPNLDQVVQNPPLNIKKQLVERFPTPGSVTFRNVSKDGGGIISVVVEILVEEGVRKQFKGRGRNKRMATLAACKCALRKLDGVE